MNAQQIVNEKLTRVKKAINLESPDRVPVVGMADFWPVGYSKKYSMQQAFYSIDVLAECYKEVFSKWNEWDAFNTTLYALGPMLDATGSKRYNVPGRDISPRAQFQHPDLSLMSAEEYSKLIEDPMKFQIEQIIPRLCNRLASNDLVLRTKALSKATLFFGQWVEKQRSYGALWRDTYGIPPVFQGTALYLPIDWLADNLRGFQQGLLDIKERPDEVRAACEALAPFILSVGLSSAPAGGDYPLLFNPQHVSPFISPKDYEKVYWPTFKKIVDQVVGRGYRIWVLFENNQEQHLERLQELPKGKVVAHIENTDLAKVKKYLGGKVCIAGGLHPRLLTRGTPQEVQEQTRSVLKLFEDEPGFIMCCSTGLPVGTKPENLQAWVDTIKKYGQVVERKRFLPEKGSDDEKTSGVVAEGKDVFTRWDTVRSEFGKIEGDERIIQGKWEELERFLPPLIYWLIK